MGLTGVILDARIKMIRVQSRFIEQISYKAQNIDELFAHFNRYDSLRYSVAWIDCTSTGNKLGRGVLITGEFFKNEALSEQEHATKFADYLIARGQSVLLEELKAPIQSWNDLEEIYTYSFQMEADVTTSLQQLYALAERSSDVRTTVFLDPIVEAQTSSEDEFAYLLGRVRFSENQPSALLIIDGELKV